MSRTIDGLEFPDELLDLSDRRLRAIAKWVWQQREDAGMNAVKIGLKTANELFGMGFERLIRLSHGWEKDIIRFYQDRDIMEPRLNAWLEDIGFVIQKHKLESYRDENGKAVPKRKAERMMENGSAKENT